MLELAGGASFTSKRPSLTGCLQPQILDKYTVFDAMVARDFSSLAANHKKLSSAALRAIWQSNPAPEVRDLLWEIRRLQDIARQAYGVLTLARMWGINRPFLTRLNELDAALFAEPCLWERPIDWSTEEEQALKRLSRGRR
ncbi:hypothetical protein [Ralstonia pseudosolanacearum]